MNTHAHSTDFLCTVLHRYQTPPLIIVALAACLSTAAVWHCPPPPLCPLCPLCGPRSDSLPLSLSRSVPFLCVFRFDDTSVSLVNETDVMSEESQRKVYLLFFEQADPAAAASTSD